MTLRDTLLIFIVILIFGTNFVAMKWGLEELPPFLFVAMRFTMVVIPLVFLVPPPKNKWYKVVGVGFFLNLMQFSLLFTALQADISAGLASLLLQLQVPLTLILSFAVLSERIGPIQLAGIILALAGFLFFIAETGGNVTLLGIALVFLAALSWACANLILKTSRSSNPLHLVVWASLVPPIPLYVLSYFTESTATLDLIAQLSLRGWLSIAYVALLSTVIGYTLWSSLMGRYSAIQVTPFALLIPIVGLISGGVILGESLTNLEIVGTIVVLLGLALCVFGPRWRHLLGRSRNGDI